MYVTTVRKQMDTRGEPLRVDDPCWNTGGEHELTYFADLSPYGYQVVETRFNERWLNVGWIDPSAPFSKGPVEHDVFERLFRLCEKPVNRCRGFHHCLYGSLESPPSRCSIPARSTLGPGTLVVGNGEIRVPGQNGIVYAAPTLICHYVQRHGYCPPAEFLEALRNYG
ncbi:MAG: hypothetical protein QOF94_1748 [Acidobacteriaceae bacterium]|jgi:hypothetical protein